MGSNSLCLVLFLPCLAASLGTFSDDSSIETRRSEVSNPTGAETATVRRQVILARFRDDVPVEQRSRNRDASREPASVIGSGADGRLTAPRSAAHRLGFSIGWWFACLAFVSLFVAALTGSRGCLIKSLVLNIAIVILAYYGKPFEAIATIAWLVIAPLPIFAVARRVNEWLWPRERATAIPAFGTVPIFTHASTFDQRFEEVPYSSSANRV
jgi:hypothetical protein